MPGQGQISLSLSLDLGAPSLPFSVAESALGEGSEEIAGAESVAGFGKEEGETEEGEIGSSFRGPQGLPLHNRALPT